MTDDTRTPATLCWHCDRMLDAASGFGPTEGAEPEPGAVSLCLYCGAVGLFGAGLVLCAPTEAELDELGEDRDFRQAFTKFAWARQYVMRRDSLLRDRGDPDR
jgi:hypothetical protein